MSEQADQPPQVTRWTTQSLLFLAAVLITNSHLERFYPHPALAGDGLLGNGMFFMVAGLGITLSARAKRQSFPSYYWRRIVRIYPTVLVVVTLFIVLWESRWREWTWIDALAAYVYPTPWAFITFVMVYYIGFYFLLRRPRFSTFALPLVAGWLLFAYFWAAHPQQGKLMLGTLHNSIYWVFWAQAMLLGGCLATAPVVRRGGLLPHVVLFCTVFALYVALKFAFVTGRVASFHFLLFPTVLLLIYLLFRIASSIPSQNFPRQFPRTAKGAGWISNRTLEIYTVQPVLAYRDDLPRVVPFPLNIAVFWILLLLLVAVVYLLAGLLRGRQRRGPAVSD